MKRNNAILIILILVFGTIGITLLLYNLVTTVEIRDLEMDLKVGNRIGFNVASDKLWFGMTNPGGTATREIVISNSNTFPIIVKFFPLGEMKNIVSVSENNVVLETSAEKTVSITASVPSDMPYGNYTGVMRVVFKKA
ncbi:MAG: hypothetical protein KJ955_04005 [Nanoarchaeota archaeon]|nr:hypothetical protein [Nanoarchaeota archaeon]